MNSWLLKNDPRSLTRGREKFGPCAVSTPQGPEFRPAPRGSADGPAVRTGRNRSAMTELLGRAGLVAVSAETADVAVIVAATLGERHDVVGHGGLPYSTLRSAVPAERFGS